MNVSLPSTLKKYVDDRISAGSFSTVSEYIHQLIREDQMRQERQELERRLLEGLDSGFSPLTPEDWEELRKRTRDGAAKRNEK